MKTLFIECNMGASGDMLMAGLLELLPNLSAREAFITKLNNLGINGVRVKAQPVVKCGITGTHISVAVGNNAAEEASVDVDMSGRVHEREHEYAVEGIHGSEHQHGGAREHSHKSNAQHHHHAGLKEIEAVISGLNISANVKKQALDVYRLIAEAESCAHNCPVSEVHFHELGSLDAVADITGVCLLMEELAPERIIASPIHVGSGMVRCSHGILPVPAPATAHILKNIPFYGGKIKGELCTPTGAALLKYFVQDFGPMPEMKIEKIGYGMGKKDFEAANCVRAFLGEISKDEFGPNEKAAQLCCNLDDMTGEAIGYACITLLNEGALDVFTTAIDMKKERPGTMLTCICETKKADMFASLMLKLTTSFGVRKTALDRYILERKTEAIQTPLGKARLKTGKGYGITKSKLEYEDVALLAKEHNISLNEAERKIWAYLEHKETKNDNLSKK